MRAPIPIIAGPAMPDLAKLINDDKAFENTSTSVAASQMRNALNNLADTVTDPEEKKVWFTPVSP
jgi:UTP--glucose-1-phosphate uridylyltransferase